MAADPQIAGGLAELSTALTEFGWMLGDTTDRLLDLVGKLLGQGVRHDRELKAARAELGALTACSSAWSRLRTPARSEKHGQARPVPYPGLRPFESRDAARFFGREDLTAHLSPGWPSRSARTRPCWSSGPPGPASPRCYGPA